MSLSYSVKSWLLPKRSVGSWPAGYIGTVIDAASPIAAAEQFARSRHDGRARAIVVASMFREHTYKLAPDGTLTEQGEQSSSFSTRERRRLRRSAL